MNPSKMSPKRSAKSPASVYCSLEENSQIQVFPGIVKYKRALKYVFKNIFYMLKQHESGGNDS